MEYTGLILDVIAIKEEDAMIRILTTSGVISFFARRAMNQKNAYHAALQPFAYTKVWINEGPQGGLALRQAKLIHYTVVNYQNLTQYALLELIRETMSLMVNNDDWESLHDLVLGTVEQGKTASKTMTATVYYLSRLLSLLGWGLEFEACVVCGSKKDIVAIDLTLGGFVCRQHYQSTTGLALSSDELKTLVIIDHLPVTALDKITCNRDEINHLFTILTTHYETVTGHQLKSSTLFN